MIGNRGHAMHIREWVRAEQENEPYGDLPRSGPDGWQFIGSGCYRAAYLSPDNVVYKVQRTPGLWSGQANIAEYQKWWALRLSYRMPEGARFPVMSCFTFEGNDDVNAMDYVGKTLNRYDGENYYKYSATLRVVSQTLGLWDMHHGNAAVDEKNGLIVPIDLG